MASEKDLIRRGDVLELLYKIKCDRSWPKNYGTLLTIINKTWIMPTVDAVEVVRCKDCRFNVVNMENDPLDATDYSDITCSYFMTDGMEPDDFCSRGVKMDGGVKE